MSDLVRLVPGSIIHLVQLLCLTIQGGLFVLGKTMCYGNEAVSAATRHCWQGAWPTAILFRWKDQASCNP